MKNLLLLIIGISVSFTSICGFANAQQTTSIQPQERFATLERSFAGEIGVYAINTNNDQTIAYRADKRFPVQSTVKFMAVSALLKQSTGDEHLLQEKINYTKNDLISWHPVTGKYVSTGMSLEALSEAAISYSDNPAINLVIKKLGGPQAITDFARSIGNNTFTLEHYDGNMNSNPKDQDDTSTPKDMAISLQKVTLGDILTQSQRDQLVTWMRNNTTGYTRIRAGVPIGWVVADKTGSGSYGIANDIAIIWSPVCRPIVLAIYTVRNQREAKRRDDIVASATRIILDEFARNDPSFKDLAESVW